MHNPGSLARAHRAVLLLVWLAALPALAQGTSVITGTVMDAETKKPLADAVVTATSPNLQGEKVALTDESGLYRLPQLPPGTYTLRLEREGYQPFAREDVQLRLETTLRVNVMLLPEGLQSTIDVVAQAPTVDVGSTTTGVNVSADFARRIALSAPGGKGSAARSFESLAEVAPGVQADTYGMSINGTSSPENGFVIDGLSVSDPAFGLLGTQLSVEFVQEVNVISGGFMPEYGRATGGVMNVVTKSGSNQFHGSVFGTLAPGGLYAGPMSTLREGAIGTDVRMWNQGDVGFELGGPILQDKLWFFVGAATAANRQRLERSLYTVDFDAAGNETNATPIANTRRDWFADQRSYQYIGKLTYNLNADHALSLSVMGTPYESGGKGRFGFDPEDGRVETRSLTGGFDALAHRYTNDSRDVALKLNSSFLDKRLLLDASLGWHHQSNTFLASDGSALGGSTGLAGVPRFNYRRSTPHSISEFETLEDPSVCDPATAGGTTRCPAYTYAYAGPGRLNDDVLDRYQAKVVGTYLAEALGHHVMKAGLDLDAVTATGRVAFSGMGTYREDRRGRFWQLHRSLGYMLGPDEPKIVPLWNTASSSNGIGAFVQDSWSVLDKVSLNVGLRYDMQTLYGGDGRLAVALPNQFSPRIGVVYDFTQQGRSKLFANYARYYQNTVMEMVNAQFPGERRLQSFYRAARGTTPGCDPLHQEAPYAECRDPGNLQTLYDRGYSNEQDPNAKWLPIRGDNVPVDPKLEAQSSDEFVVGGEYQLFDDARAGLTYTRRYMNAVIEDMSNDQATTFFLGNPGQGIASAFQPAVRDYDAVTVFLDKRFSNQWLGQISYTWSSLRGNYTGMFRPESGQLAPNITSDFDLASLLQNRLGPLPSDRTHAIKAYGAREFLLPAKVVLDVGLTYRGQSGTPLSVLGSHDLYGDGQVFLLERGAAGRLPWVHNIDARVGVGYPVARGMVATLSADVFNVFNFQQEVARDQNYTFDVVDPLVNSRDLGALEGLDVKRNPNYGKTTAYQAPRSIRVSAKLSF